jgi:hypothetical protein
MLEKSYIQKKETRKSLPPDADRGFCAIAMVAGTASVPVSNSVPFVLRRNFGHKD